MTIPPTARQAATAAEALWTFQKGESLYTCELVSHDGIGIEARILMDGELLVSRRFAEDWQTLQWAEEERQYFENGGE